MRGFEIESRADYARRQKPRDTSRDQAGAVLVFKPGVTKAQAEDAIERVRDLLAYRPVVNTFDPDIGGPVWYIP